MQRRRAAEEEREVRLLDPKVRMIGVDVDALDRQVAEKRVILGEESQKRAEADKQDAVCDKAGKGSDGSGGGLPTAGAGDGDALRARCDRP